MNKLSRRIFTYILTILIVGMSFIIDSADLYADTIVEPYIIVNSYRVDNDVLTPGSSFTLLIEVANSSDTDSAYSVLANISTDSGVSPIYSTVTQKYVGDFAPGEVKTISFDFEINQHYLYDTTSFYLTLTSLTKSNYVTIKVPVALNSDLFFISSKSIPEEAIIGQLFTSSVSFKSLSSENLSNVALNVYMDGQQITNSSIGNLYPGASKTQNVSFYVSEAGKHSLLYELSCIDSDGSVATIEIFNGTVIAKAANVSPEVDIEKTQELVRFSQRDIAIMAGCLGLSLLLVVGIILIVRKYN